VTKKKVAKNHFQLTLLYTVKNVMFKDDTKCNTTREIWFYELPKTFWYYIIRHYQTVLATQRHDRKRLKKKK